MADRPRRAPLPACRASGRGGHAGRHAGRRPDGGVAVARGRQLSRRQRGPERLPGVADAHAHLQHPAFAADLDAVLERARGAGLVRIVVPGWDLASSEAALDLAAAHPDLLVAAVGIHPHDAAAMDEAGWARLETLAHEPGAAAIGEIGLDFHRNLSPPERQREAFARQLDLAVQLRRPVLVHDREAHAEIAAALLGRSGLTGVLHAFSGDRAMALELAAAGFLISFALPLAFRSASGPRAAAPVLPDGALLVETDAPFLGPVAAARNEPTTVLRVAAELARLRGTSPDAIGRVTSANLARLVPERAAQGRA